MFRSSIPSGAANPAEKMRFVKYVCENAPMNDKTSVSLRRYRSAERAQVFGNETECIRRLDVAIKALK